MFYFQLTACCINIFYTKMLLQYLKRIKSKIYKNDELFISCHTSQYSWFYMIFNITFMFNALLLSKLFFLSPFWVGEGIFVKPNFWGVFLWGFMGGHTYYNKWLIFWRNLAFSKNCFGLVKAGHLIKIWSHNFIWWPLGQAKKMLILGLCGALQDN